MIWNTIFECRLIDTSNYKVARRFNVSILNVKYPRHVTPILIFIIFHPYI